MHRITPHIKLQVRLILGVKVKGYIEQGVIVLGVNLLYCYTGFIGTVSHRFREGDTVS